MWIYDTRHLEILVNRLLSSLVLAFIRVQFESRDHNPVQPLGSLEPIHGESFLIGDDCFVFLCVQTDIHSNRTRFLPDLRDDSSGFPSSIDCT